MKSFNGKKRNVLCVHQDTLIRVKTRKGPLLVPISRINKHDRVQTSDGDYARVECVVETVVDENHEYSLMMIQIGKLIVTPYHPIQTKDSTKWIFPIDATDGEIVDSRDVKTPSIYNLILEKRSRHKAVVMDGMNTITLGHGITKNDVLRHEYFGADGIIEDLKRFDRNGYNKGHIILKEENISRKDEVMEDFTSENINVEDYIAKIA